MWGNEVSFPEGPFFNFRTNDEVGFFKRLIFIIFGEKKVGIDGFYKVTAYHLKNITYIHKVELAVRDEAAEKHSSVYIDNEIRIRAHVGFECGFDKGAEEMAKIKDAQIEKLVNACNELLNNYWIDDQNPHNDPTIERVYLHQLRKVLDNFREWRREEK